MLPGVLVEGSGGVGAGLARFVEGGALTVERELLLESQVVTPPLLLVGEVEITHGRGRRVER